MTYKERLHDVIPGGAHTYSRGDDQFPSNAPSILEKGEGAFVYCPDGQRYLDYGMGLRSVNIGYGNIEIADACYNEIIKGNNLTRASVTELKAAELMSDLIPSIEMVKFAKHGSTVTSAAVKLARAYTGRKYIAIPYEQPFFSFDDWFIGSTVMNRGVLEETSLFTIKFHYNDINSVNELFQKYEGQIAGIILEAATTLNPCHSNCDSKIKCHECPKNTSNFLHQVQSSCKRNGALFILDEMITGFRWHLQGAQTFYNIQPDLCTFGKAMANGFAVAVLGGKAEIMKLGSILKEGEERVFLTSTTHGAEMSALGAFIKTVEILKRDNVISHFWTYGTKLMDGMNDISQSLGIKSNFVVEGYPCSPGYVTKDFEGNNSLSLRTLFAQEMIKNRVIMPYLAISYSHQDSELNQTLEAVFNSLKVVSKALESGIQGYLESPIIKPVFRKIN
ncbi:MAG: glutamate-1-semialdehyde 2,1-aminomutase [Bacteroidota bacterium]|jgi:glutamate-1-semialdehyde 2,1-aminomutase